MDRISDLIKKSPFGPIQKHMDKAKASVDELIIFLESVINMEWEKAIQSRKKIVDLEHQADALKAETRGLVPKSIFLSVPREDVLELVKRTDEIPNTVKGISGLMIGRRMEVPSQISTTFMQFASEAAEICKVASNATNHIDELFQFAFGGNAADEMQKLIRQLDTLEDHCDETEIMLRSQLFAIERDLPPIDVMFLYSVINKIGELADIAEQVGHRISLIASR
jgi:hypothetical protein